MSSVELQEPESRAALLIGEQRYAMCSAMVGAVHDVPFAFAEAIEPFNFLAQALELHSPPIFERYLGWLASRLRVGDPAAGPLEVRLDQVSRVVADFLPAAEAECAMGYIRSAQAAASRAAEQTGAAGGVGEVGEGAAPAAGESLSAPAAGFLDALLAFDKVRAGAVARQAVGEGMGMRALYLSLLQPVLREVGALWQANRLSVAQEHFASVATLEVMAQLHGGFQRAGPNGLTVVCASVAGEAHDIGARMLADLFEAAGWRAIFFGANTPGADLLRTAIEQRADLLALSCTYAPNLHELSALVHTVRALPECGAMKVLVGGYAFEGMPSLWRQVGADAYAPDAATAVDMAAALVGKDARPPQRAVGGGPACSRPGVKG